MCVCVCVCVCICTSSSINVHDTKHFPKKYFFSKPTIIIYSHLKQHEHATVENLPLPDAEAKLRIF